jgi:hypothetical protein
MEAGDMMSRDGVADVARSEPKTSGKISPGVARRDSTGFSNLRLAGAAEWAAQESIMGICTAVGGLDVCVLVFVD